MISLLVTVYALTVGRVKTVNMRMNQMNEVIIIYAHGTKGNDQVEDNIKVDYLRMAECIKRLNNLKINNFIFKTYYLPLKVTGWTKDEEKQFWNLFETSNYNINVEDKNGKLINKWSGWSRLNIIKNKILEFKQSHNNVLLAGHSAGAWDSIVLKSQYPDLIDAVIALSPARCGPYAKRKQDKLIEVNWRKHKQNMIDIENLYNVLVYCHDKDGFENTQTLQFLNTDNIKFLTFDNPNLTEKYHTYPLSKSFADEDKHILKFIKGIYG